MFSSRVLTLCLLLIYGGPAVVGPYLHVHGHICKDDSSGQHPAAGHDHDGGHCGSAHEAVCEVSDQTIQLGTLATLEISKCSTHHDDCAVCRHFSQSHANCLFEDSSASVLVISAPDSPDLAFVSAARHFCDARGPPAA